MADSKAKRELVAFLNKKAFDPVLKKNPDEYATQVDKEKLRKVQHSTQSTKEKYNHEYGSAEEIVMRFKGHLHSKAAKKVHENLRDLGLPTLNDLRDEFSKLSERLGVHS
jgi:hypothetical protein